MKNKYLFSLVLLILIQLSKGQTILGIDISHHQGTINWTSVYNDGKSFAFVKATEGFTYNDPNFTANMTNGNAAGVVMGAYHFARPDNNSATNEANHFVSIAGNYIGQGYLPPVLDLEDPNSNTHLTQMFSRTQLTNWVQTWLTSVENQTGVRPVIYTNSNLAGYLLNSVNTYGLWIAKPGTSPNTPPSNLGVWTTWKFKQYSWYGSVNGISGNVDLNSFHGTISDFQTLIGTNAITISQIAGLKVYPNPTDGFVNLQADNNNLQSVKIFDVNGRFLRETNIATNPKIDLQELSAGIYFLNIKDINNNVARIRIVKN